MLLTLYQEVKVKIPHNQKDKIQRVIKSSTSVTIRIIEIGDGVLALTKAQIKKLEKVFCSKERSQHYFE